MGKEGGRSFGGLRGGAAVSMAPRISVGVAERAPAVSTISRTRISSVIPQPSRSPSGPRNFAAMPEFLPNRIQSTERLGIVPQKSLLDSKPFPVPGLTPKEIRMQKVIGKNVSAREGKRYEPFRISEPKTVGEQKGKVTSEGLRTMLEQPNYQGMFGRRMEAPRAVENSHTISVVDPVPVNPNQGRIMAIELKSRGEIRPLRFDAYKPNRELGKNVKGESAITQNAVNVRTNERRLAILRELQSLSKQQARLVEKTNPVTPDVSSIKPAIAVEPKIDRTSELQSIVIPLPDASLHAGVTYSDLLKKREQIKVGLREDSKKTEAKNTLRSKLRKGMELVATKTKKVLRFALVKKQSAILELEPEEKKKRKRLVVQEIRTQTQSVLETNNKLSVKPQIQETQAVSLSSEHATQLQIAAENKMQTIGEVVVFSESHKNNQDEGITYAIDQSAQKARESAAENAIENAAARDAEQIEGTEVAAQVAQSSDESMISGLLKILSGNANDGSLEALIQFIAKLGSVSKKEARQRIGEGLQRYPAVLLGKGRKATEKQVKLVIEGPTKKDVALAA